MLMLKNKRADIPTMVLVFLVLMTATASLFVFATSDKRVQVEISDVGLIQDAQLKQGIAEFYISEAIEKSLVKSYLEMLNQNKYIESPIYISANEVKLGYLHGNLNNLFYKKFNEEFKIEFENYAFQEDYLNNLKGLIKEDKFSSSFNGENIIFENSLLEINRASEKNKVIYFPEIFLNISFSRIGLNSFNSVYNSKEKCKDKETAELIKECFSNELGAFNVEVAEKANPANEKYFLITLTSKKKFLIEDEFKEIKFSFVFQG